MYFETVDQSTVGSQWVAVPDGSSSAASIETSLTLLPPLPSSALAAITHPIGAKAQPHAPLLKRFRHPAQESVIVFVLIRLEIEITRDPAQGFISDSFDKFPH